MSTVVYQCDLYADIWKKGELVESLNNQAESVKRQIDAGCEKIEIHVCGVQIHLEYDEGEINVVA